MPSSEPSGLNTINSDLELLRHLRMSEAEAAMFIGCVRSSVSKRLKSNRLRFIDIFPLVNSALQMGRRIDVAAVRSYVERTCDTREGVSGEDHEKLKRLLSASYEKVERRVDDILLLILSYPLRSNDDRMFTAGCELVAINPSTAYLLSSGYHASRGIGENFDIAGERCLFDDIASHYLPSVLLYNPRTDEFRRYVFGEEGDFVEAPWNPIDHRFMECMFPNEVMGVFGKVHADA